uniref:Dynein heavy chain C-terminal domain-containing protein n=1 Tax=Timema monikensis TaxID=170555 RepID=A0A7R9EIH6_9NEOP|nr:unnamed protein product [Timema monikensis]
MLLVLVRVCDFERSTAEAVSTGARGAQGATMNSHSARNISQAVFSPVKASRHKGDNLSQTHELPTSLMYKEFMLPVLVLYALIGEIGMDAVLDNVAYSLYNGQLPLEWRRLTPATCKNLGGWMDYFLQRISQYMSWCVSGEPMVMWLSGLHIPESYLTALVQIACRKNGWPLDRSTLYTTVSVYRNADDVEQRPDMGCYASGMFLVSGLLRLRYVACFRTATPLGCFLFQGCYASGMFLVSGLLRLRAATPLGCFLFQGCYASGMLLVSGLLRLWDVSCFRAAMPLGCFLFQGCYASGMLLVSGLLRLRAAMPLGCFLFQGCYASGMFLVSGLLRLWDVSCFRAATPLGCLFQGCYASGMFLEGGRWDDESSCLARSYPKVLIEELPILLITPVESHRLRLQNTLRTPVYTTSERRNAMGVGLVFEADLTTTEHISHWVLQGVCLILNTD